VTVYTASAAAAVYGVCYVLGRPRWAENYLREMMTKVARLVFEDFLCIDTAIKYINYQICTILGLVPAIESW